MCECYADVVTDHSLADRRSNEGVLDKVVSESFSEERICTQEIGEHLIVADDTITGSECVHVRVCVCMCTRNSQRVQCMNKQSRIGFLMDGVTRCYAYKGP